MKGEERRKPHKSYKVKVHIQRSTHPNSMGPDVPTGMVYSMEPSDVTLFAPTAFEKPYDWPGPHSACAVEGGGKEGICTIVPASGM